MGRCFTDATLECARRLRSVTHTAGAARSPAAETLGHVRSSVMVLIASFKYPCGDSNDVTFSSKQLPFSHACKRDRTAIYDKPPYPARGGGTVANFRDQIPVPRLARGKALVLAHLVNLEQLLLKSSHELCQVSRTKPTIATCEAATPEITDSDISNPSPVRVPRPDRSWARLDQLRARLCSPRR